MKAKVIKTGAVIDVEPIGEYRPDGIRWRTNTKSSVEHIYKDEDLDFFDLFDWRAFRREAAKDILCGVLSGGIAAGAIGFVNEKKSLVASAIEVADELIKQLKEDEK